MNGGSAIFGHTNDGLLSRNHDATALQVTSVVKSKIRVFMEYEWDENKTPQMIGNLAEALVEQAVA